MLLPSSDFKLGLRLDAEDEDTTTLETSVRIYQSTGRNIARNLNVFVSVGE
jgi:hypothetical protein